MENDNYINIQGWMRTELGLSGFRLMTYAIIYGFCQDGESCYSGGHKYIMEWLGCSKVTVRRILKSLTEEGKIIRKDVGKNGIAVQTYTTTPLNLIGVTPLKMIAVPSQNDRGTPIKMIDININNKNKKENKDIYSRFDFLKALKSLGVSDQLAADWMRVRKNKRLTNTKTAFDNIAAEIAKTGRPAEDCVKLAVERSWGGFKSEWMPRQQEGVWQGSIDDYLKSQGYALND